jgi:hypothetical protein
MTGNDFMIAPPPARPASAGATVRPPAPVPSATDEKHCEPVILDMGEASRLQGFRQHGCR